MEGVGKRGQGKDTGFRVKHAVKWGSRGALWVGGKGGGRKEKKGEGEEKGQQGRKGQGRGDMERKRRRAQDHAQTLLS